MDYGHESYVFFMDEQTNRFRNPFGLKGCIRFLVNDNDFFGLDGLDDFLDGLSIRMARGVDVQKPDVSIESLSHHTDLFLCDTI